MRLPHVTTAFPEQVLNMGVTEVTKGRKQFSGGENRKLSTTPSVFNRDTI